VPAKSDNPVELERRLHERLLAGDPLASTDLFDHFSIPIVRGLVSRYRTTDHELVEEAVSQSLLDYFVHPERYDASKRSLRGYLKMAAERDLLTLRQRRLRNRHHIHEATPYELDSQAHHRWRSGGDVVDQIADAESAATLADAMMAVARTEEERIVQELRMDGERATAVYVAALGWHNLTPTEQQRHLYRIKDRLDQRLRRRKQSEGSG
jgi:RNA polymerase sigma-70 factor (ECF subfamily)